MWGIPGAGLLATLVARVRSLFRGLSSRDRIEADMSEEFQHHIQLRAEHLMREGLGRREALRQAHREFGHLETHKEAARASRGLHVFDQIRFSWLDVKLAMRMLVKHPGLTVVAVFALGIGIPVGMAPMHVARSIEAPLPEDPENRIRAIRFWDALSSGTEQATYAEYMGWRDEASSFESMGATRPSRYKRQFRGRARRSRGRRPALGVRVPDPGDRAGHGPHPRGRGRGDRWFRRGRDRPRPVGFQVRGGPPRWSGVRSGLRRCRTRSWA